MYQDKKILCIIPARGGSKRLPGKNIKPFLGKPLVSYAIDAAKHSKYVDRVVVSTDDEAIANAARECGAEVPFMRPEELATDTASIIPVLVHAAEFVEQGGEKVDLVVLIQPTTPGVRAEDVDKTIETLLSSGARSAITVCEIGERPEFMYRVKENGLLERYSRAELGRSQDMEPLYRINGAVYAALRTLLSEGKIVDQESVAYVLMPRERSVDIDTAADFAMAESFLS